MKRKIIKILSVFLCLVLVVSYVPSVSAKDTTIIALEGLSCSAANPAYASGISYSQVATTAFSNQYFALDENSTLDDCLTDVSDVADEVRKEMQERDTYFEIDFAVHEDDFRYFESHFNDFSNAVLSDVFEENDDPTAGDYLFYSWTNYNLNTSDYAKQIVSPSGLYYGFTLYYSFGYYTTKAQEDIVDDKVEELLDNFGFSENASEREKADVIYDYITDNVTYDYDNLNDKNYKLKFTAYAALVNKTAVCEGYAVLFYRLAEECGLDARVITGSGGNTRDINHAWNIVKIGSNYYYLDSTWDAEVNGNYRYYLKGSTDFGAHTNEDKFNTAAFQTRYPIPLTGIDMSTSGSENDFDYSVDNYGKATITGYNGNDSNVVVPATIKGYPVVSIADMTFNSNHTSIERISFSEGILGIHFEAIFGVPNLKEIYYPSTMKLEFDRYADGVLSGYSTIPYYCSKLETIGVSTSNPYMKVKNGVLYTSDEKVLIQCPTQYELEVFSIPSSVEEIAPSAFAGCEKIKKIVMPDSVKLIGYCAFLGATHLTSVNISERCEIIGQFAFGNTAVTELHIPAATNKILSGAFGPECKLANITVDSDNEEYYIQNSTLISDENLLLHFGNATSYIVPEGILVIDQYAFANNKKLYNITLPNSLIDLGSYAFENCTALEHVMLPSSLDTLHNYTFLGCTRLASVIIPATITTIDIANDDMIFWDNNGLTIYGESGSAAENYASTFGYNFKTINQFVCSSGHDLKKSIVDEHYYNFVCDNCGDKTGNFLLQHLQAAEISLEFDSAVYTGKEIKPTVSVKYGDKLLVEGVDYTVEYLNNILVGSGEVKLTGIGDCTGVVYAYFTITPISIANKKIVLEYTTTIYDGFEKQPDVTIEGLQRFVDFDVEYSNNVKVGTANIRIYGFGNYEGEINKTFEIISADLPAPSSLTLSLYGYDDVKVSWSKVSGAVGYIVEYKKSADKSYSTVKTTSTSYSLANLADSTTYTIRVKAYNASKTSSKYKSGTIETYRDLKAPSKVSASLYGHDDVVVSWSKVSYAKGYYVYYKTSSAKSYTYLGYTTGTSCKKANLSDGVSYTFMVKPYSVANGKKYVDGSYKNVSIYTLKKISTPTVKKYSSKKVKVSWKNISGESGYQISQSTSKSKTKIVSTYTTTSGKSKTISAKKGKTYYYKVRAFKTVNGKKIYGPWSSVKSYKIK